MSSSYQRRQALESSETTATVLRVILDEKYGESWYAWDPVTVALECQADWNADPSSESMDRICAVQAILASNAFFRRIDAFAGIVHTLNTGAPAFDAFDPVSVEEVCWAVAEVAFNRELLPFSYPVRIYIKKLLADDGYDETSCPDLLKEVFERDPGAAVVRKAVRTPDQSDANRDNVDKYVEEQLGDLSAQFDRIVDLKGLDDMIMARGLEEALETRGV